MRCSACGFFMGPFSMNESSSAAFTSAAVLDEDLLRLVAGEGRPQEREQAVRVEFVQLLPAPRTGTPRDGGGTRNTTPWDRPLARRPSGTEGSHTRAQPGHDDRGLGETGRRMRRASRTRTG